MAQSPSSKYNALDINPESNVIITLDFGASRISLTPETSHSRDESSSEHSPAGESPDAVQSEPFDMSCQLELFRPCDPLNPIPREHVLEMPLDALDLFNAWVLHMELSNMRLLTAVYGEFAEDLRPFPMLTRIPPDRFPPRGSITQRELLFAQYQNMVSVARHPVKCVGYLEPSSAEGAALLQQYQKRMLEVDEANRKTKHEDSKERGTEKAKKSDKSRNPKLQILSDQKAAMTLREYQEWLIMLDCRSRLGRRGMARKSSSQPEPTGDALTDYQTQLMLLEQLNKQRLELARKASDQSEPSKMQALADYQMQLMLLEQQNKKRPACALARLALENNYPGALSPTKTELDSEDSQLLDHDSDNEFDTALPRLPIRTKDR